ncbi:EamA-like transporter family protein [compost metagenome]
MIYIKFKNQEIEISSKGVLYSCLAGFFVGLAEVLTFFVFGKGTPASVAGSVAVAAILGILVLREQLTLIQGLGTLLIIGGVVLLSLNSGGH